MNEQIKVVDQCVERKIERLPLFSGPIERGREWTDVTLSLPVGARVIGATLAVRAFGDRAEVKLEVLSAGPQAGEVERRFLVAMRSSVAQPLPALSPTANVEKIAAPREAEVEFMVLEVDPPMPGALVAVRYGDNYADDWPRPAYAKAGDAGFDLRAAFSEPAVEIGPGENRLIPTGLFLEMPRALEMDIRPRSGKAHKDRLGVSNAPGTIDSGFRNEIQVSLENRGSKTQRIERGERIAQGVFLRPVHAAFAEVDVLGGSERGLGGFGHSGDH